MRASDLEEFRVKRTGPFEFAEKPTVTRRGDRVTIRFKARAFCDVTVAIEDPSASSGRWPRIVRYLACGVLGPNAPEPFRKNSLEQVIVWDGKDEQGRYVDDKRRLRVRVSLGLKPRFERTLFWAPGRRVSAEPPAVCPTPEGVYVYEGAGFNHVRLYDHDGNYVRTVYPFPADAIGKAEGLHWHAWPQDGERLPVKHNFPQTTFLSSGTNSHHAITWRPKLKRYESTIGVPYYHPSMGGHAARTMAVHRGRIALAYLKLNRLATDGTTGGLPIGGPETTIPVKLRRVHSFRGGVRPIAPRSSAFSPDGRWLYLAGYRWDHKWIIDGLHGVTRLPYEGGGEMKRFAGSLKKGDSGAGDGEFRYATSVACDANGRVYVGDYMNDRVQVFSPGGEHLKNIPVKKPVELTVDRRTGELYVASWKLVNNQLRSWEGRLKKQRRPVPKIASKVSRYGPFENPRLIESAPLKLERYYVHHGGDGFEYSAKVDTYADPARVWVTAWGPPKSRNEPYEKACLRLYEWRGRKLVLMRELGREPKRRLGSLEFRARSRLYVNPVTGALYVACMSQPDHGTGAAKAFPYAVRLDPETGEGRVVRLPVDAEDMAFDLDGRAYLRGMSAVGRFDPRTWREVPWDYGERRKTGFMNKRPTLLSALPTVAGINWHMGGMGVSPRGHLVVATYMQSKQIESRKDEKTAAVGAGDAYLPRVYPGRLLGGKHPVVHVWDEHGKVIYEDAVPGIGITHGVEIDRDAHLYVLDTAARILDGRRYFNDMAGTLIKFAPKTGLVYSTRNTPIPLSKERRPDRPPDLANAGHGRAWVEGAAWLFGGLGWGGKNRGIGCDCWNCQFDLDYFRRAFAPETDRYSVAVIDGNGNLICRFGTYGNVDDGMPLVREGGPPHPRSIGGGEVALCHGAYVAVHTDRRAFITDNGNARVLSVELGYHRTETVRLGDVADDAD
ncbi:MAG: hypothetical protein R6V58_03235 [Planctomycetota bacterium]